MTAADHNRFADDVGAYLLGALPDAERVDFERHLEGCVVCHEEVERLRPAADLLPRSVEQLEPPPSLKRSLMEAVEGDAAERAARGPATARPRRRGLFAPRLRPAFAAAAILLAVAAGFGAQQLLDDGGGTRTLAATVKPSVLPGASGTLRISDDGSDGAILEVHGMRSLKRGRVYQAWVERDGKVEPEPTFEVGADGNGAVAVPEDLSGAQAVHLTREPHGGSAAPSEAPVLTVRL